MPISVVQIISERSNLDALLRDSTSKPWCYLGAAETSAGYINVLGFKECQHQRTTGNVIPQLKSVKAGLIQDMKHHRKCVFEFLPPKPWPPAAVRRLRLDGSVIIVLQRRRRKLCANRDTGSRPPD